MRKMRPLEPAGSAGSAGAVSGLATASGLADCFFAGKREFYQEDSFESQVSSLKKTKGDHGFARIPRISRVDLLHEHTIPIGEETIPLSHRMLIRGEGAFAAGEG